MMDSRRALSVSRIKQLCIIAVQSNEEYTISLYMLYSSFISYHIILLNNTSSSILINNTICMHIYIQLLSTNRKEKEKRQKRETES